jgi:hypothetical protein
MENLENTPVVQPDNDLQGQLDSLRHLVASALVLILILAGTLDLFLLRLVKGTRTERDGMNNMIAEYNKTTAPAMNDFIKRLAEFGKTHSDFTPILVKYGLVNRPGATPTSAAPSSVAPTGASPAPAAAPAAAPKKK